LDVAVETGEFFSDFFFETADNGDRQYHDGASQQDAKRGNSHYGTRQLFLSFGGKNNASGDESFSAQKVTS
jgi:hypothetical protein